MMAPCNPTALNAMARGKTSAGTSAGVKACCAGIWKARTTPSATAIASKSSRCNQPPCVASIRSSATATCVVWHSARMRARWKRSTTCPATSTSASAGRNCSKPTSPRSQAEPVRSYICQATATISICAAAVPARRANHRRMKAG